MMRSRAYFSIQTLPSLLAIASIAVMLLLSGCKGSEILAPEPSALDLDKSAPQCPGLSSLTLASGPTITATWNAGVDNVSGASNITYYVYMRSSTQSYDLVSPTKIVLGSTTALISSGVSIGTTYTLFVSCRDQAGNQYPTGPANEMSISISDSTNPSAITDLSAGNATSTSILLTWSPSDDGASGTTASNMRYRVYASMVSPVSTSGTPLATLTGTTSYLHSAPLNPNETWYYRVVALDAVGNSSGSSNEATTTTVDDTTAPTFSGNSSAVALVSASLGPPPSITISWAQATDNVTNNAAMRYDIFRCNSSTSCNPFSLAAVATVTGSLNYTDSGLAASTSYVYGVRAKDYRGNLSINTDTRLLSTPYSAAGEFYSYPTLAEVGIRMGSDVVVANVVGTATGATAYPDLIVGAPLASEPNGRYQRTGCVFIFAGTAAGQFSTTATQVFCQPSATGNGNANARNFGHSIGVGDFNGDGTMDVLVSNPQLSIAYFYFSSNTSGTLTFDTSAPVTFNGTSATWGMGICTGNLDGTGGADIVMMAPGENCVNNATSGGACPYTGTGNVYLYKNTSTGGSFSVPTSANLTMSPTNHIASGGTAPATGAFAVGNNEQLARRCTIGNFDQRSGYETDNIIVLASGQTNSSGAAADGSLAFYTVGLSGGNFTMTARNVIASSTTEVPTGSSWGEAVSAIRLNSSGNLGLAVGASTDSSVGTNSGAVYLYTVAANAGTGVFGITDTEVTYYGARDFDGNGVGSGVFAADLYNRGAGGAQDLIYGASVDDVTNIAGATLDIGEVYVHRNLNNGTISTAILQNNFNTTSLMVRVNQEYGYSMCRGDVNNDGREDIMVGARLQDYDPRTMRNNANVGAVYIYYGVASGEIDFTAPSQILYGPGNQANGNFGTACVVMDYNGDGAKDLLVGSYSRTVGATANRGIVYIYYGASSTELPTAQSATLNPPSLVTYPGAIGFGFAMAKGDWDGNGYDDLAVSAPAVTGGGRVFIYWANGSGVIQSSTTPTNLTAPNGTAGAAGNLHLANDRSSAGTGVGPFNTVAFGYSLASFATRPRVSGVLGQDLIVCAPGYDTNTSDFFNLSTARADHGLCFIYEGAINDTGAASTNYISASPQNEIRNLDNTGYASTFFGSAMTVGRWDSDPADDLIVCAVQNRNDITLVSGACYAYQGAYDTTTSTVLGGFKLTNTWKPNKASTREVPSHSDKIYNPNPETNIAYGWFGKSVLLTDINNNGTADLLVGEPNADSATTGGGTGTPPTVLGQDSGRVYIIRGGY